MAREGGREEPAVADAAGAGEGGCSLRAEGRKDEEGGGEEVETGGLITSHTDAVHCRGDSALAYPEAYAIAHNHMRPRIGSLCMYMCVCAYVWDCACLFRTC